MENEQIIVGAILIILGGLQAVRPDLFMRFQIWSQKVIMGANYQPTERTYKITRILGAVLVVFGLLIITGVIE